MYKNQFHLKVKQIKASPKITQEMLKDLEK